MEGKTRAAVLAACLLVLLLSGQPTRVSGELPGYDRCYPECYEHCQTTQCQSFEQQKMNSYRHSLNNTFFLPPFQVYMKT
jgi:hypothetical protein